MKLAEVDFTGEENPAASDPLVLLEDLSDVGNFKEKLCELGKLVKVCRAEGSPCWYLGQESRPTEAAIYCGSSG